MISSELPDRETCREWVKEKWDRCNEPAIGVIWGKLFPPAALGPRCHAHLCYWCNERSVEQIFREGFAVYDLRPVNALHGLLDS